MRNNDKEGGMSEEEIISMAQVLLVAGTETSATLLSGATYYLTKNPQTIERLKLEVRGAFSSPDGISIEATARLPYLNAVIEESLRMYPPTAVRLPRRTDAQGANICGMYVPPNVSGTISQRKSFDHGLSDSRLPSAFIS